MPSIAGAVNPGPGRSVASYPAVAMIGPMLHPIAFALTVLPIGAVPLASQSEPIVIDKAVHHLGADSLLLLVVLHVAAALKHHFWDADNVLLRMLPFTTRRGAGRPEERR